MTIEEKNNKIISMLNENKDREEIFGKGISQLIHDIRNPLNIIIGFSSIVQIDETVNDEIRTYLKKIFQSGMAIEQLLSNIDYYMMERYDLEETTIDVEEEANIFLKSKADIINEKQVIVNINYNDKILIKFSPEIFNRIFENLFLFSSKAFRTSKIKEVIVFFKQIDNFFYMVYVDSSDFVLINGDFFTFNEVLDSKRGLGPKFIERFVNIYNGNIYYLKNRDLNKKLEEFGLSFNVKNYNGFIIKIPTNNK
ncbi:MAG TPA: histidine kinase dimerization/phospho-acceptor domain-containing protein [Spirochaetota bacterium]|nr:histidine kinase dimerization/phospho-acceptor domain-containing protein [Spirochaetota bacterium]